MKQTAISQLIQNLELIKEEFNTKWDGDPLARRGIVIAINEAKELLQTEKEQIQKAFSDGQETPINHPTLPHYSNEEYYNETFEK